jgi:hypothetical protein
MKSIFTHPGRGHKDDFLACCIALASSGQYLPYIHRTEDIPSEAFEDPDAWIIDIGGRHEPDLNNFDHHQLPKEHDACCALTLVLKKLGLYDEALLALPWLRSLEILDSKGPMAVSKFLEREQNPDMVTAIVEVLREKVGTGLVSAAQKSEENIDDLVEIAAISVANKIARRIKDKAKTWDKVIVPMLSPIDTFVLNDFQMLGEIAPTYNIWVMMREIGLNILQSIEDFKTFYNFLVANGTVQEVKGLKVLISPEDAKQLNNVSQVVEAWRAHVSPDAAVSISPDERGPGYSLYRFGDNPRVDFTLIAGLPGVKFTHVNGFIAKTETRDIEAALTLVSLAIKG